MGRKRKAKLYLRGRTWWSWFRDHTGKRRRVSTHQTDRALAEQAARRIEEAFFAQPPDAERVTVEDALARCLAKCERAARSENTLDFYLKKAKPLLEILGAQTPINALRLSDIESFMDVREQEILRRRPESDRAVATIGKELGLLRSALRYMAKQRGSDGQKLYRFDTAEIFPEGVLGNYKPRDRALSLAEYQALYLALLPPRREYLQAFCGLGVRDSELYRITASDVTDDGRVGDPGTKTDAAERWLHPPNELLVMLQRRAEDVGPDQPIFPEWANVRRDLHAACERAEIAPVSPNDLRRTFATWQAEAGVPEAVTASLMGHTSSAMVRRVYAKIGTDAKRAALAKLPPLAPPPSVMLIVINDSEKAPPQRRMRRAAPTASSEKPPENGDLKVPRDGIEPPTRGFSKVSRSRGKRNQIRTFGPFVGGLAAGMPQELVPIVRPRTKKRGKRGKSSPASWQV